MTEAATPPRTEIVTEEGRRKAWNSLMWTDHGFIRIAYQNFHWIDKDMARAGQPSPDHLKRYAAMGIKTILNLRGPNDSGHYVLEKEACEQLGMTLVDFPVKSRDVPLKEQITGAKALYETMAYPALMHCKSGADRAGLMSTLYAHFKMGLPISAALEQLSFKYLHVRQGKTGMIDFFFETYLAQTKEQKPFLAWVLEDYDPPIVKSQFMSQWWANILVDKILKRE